MVLAVKLKHFFKMEKIFAGFTEPNAFSKKKSGNFAIFQSSGHLNKFHIFSVGTVILFSREI